MPIPRPTRFGLPLLAKELLEQSARKRTYVLRTVYACLLFFVGLMFFYEVIYDGLQNPLSVLGRGGNIFELLMGLQLTGIYLFMPAITCPVITTEKERKTLGLLFLTKLGPWTIVLEKYLGRCFTMLTFLMLCLPLMAFCYALGGVTAQDIIIGAWMLLITTLQVGAFALLCSCWHHSTSGAFVATYVWGFLFYFGPPMLGEVSDVFEFPFELIGTLTNLVFSPVFGDDPNVFRHPRMATAMWIPPVMLFDNWNTNLLLAFVRSVPTLLTTAGFLWLARVFLVRRAFVPARNSLLQLFRRLDGLFARWNENRWTKGIVVIRESTTLPDDEPIAWRETKKKSLGTVRYLIRVFLVLEVPVVALCLLLVIYNSSMSWNRVPDELSVLYFGVWMLAVLMIVVKATSLIAGERSHETLDVLLTTPLSTEEIVTQKLRGLWRLSFVVAVPLLTIILFETFWRYDAGPAYYSSPEGRPFFIDLIPLILGGLAGWLLWRRTAGVEQWIRMAGLGAVLLVTTVVSSGWQAVLWMSGARDAADKSPGLYAFASLLAVGIYLPLVAWSSLYIGMRMTTQARALFAALATVVGWCVGPLILLIPVFIVFSSGPSDPPMFLLLCGPATIVPFIEFAELGEFGGSPWVTVILNFLFYGLMLALLRGKCLKDASRYLGRAEPR